MALTPGTRLGPYEVTAHIGEGGMGQVWRATDTTLGRQVAIKIDGRRVTAAAAVNQSGGVRDHVVFVLNFADYLATIAPSQRRRDSAH